MPGGSEGFPAVIWLVQAEAIRQPEDHTEREEPQPPITSLETTRSGDRALDFERTAEPVRSTAVKGLFILALFYTFYLARSFLLPIVIALIGTFVLAPLVRWLKAKWRLPESVSATALMVLVGGFVMYQAFMVSGPLITWLNEAPAMVQRVKEKLRGPIQTVTEATEKLNAATGGTETNNNKGPVEVTVKDPANGLGQTLLTWVPFILGNATVTIILLLFFLIYGDLFLLKVVKVMPTFSDKKNAVEIAHKIESQVSSYLATITIINTGLGVAIGAAMALWGMPNPVLLGVLGGLLNYIPYIGGVIGIIVVAMIAFTQFDAPAYALMVPLTYLALTTIEGYFVTPILLGRRLILNPVVIFLGLLFWGWIWSIPGMLLAVPILAVFKIFCDHIKPLEPVGEFLGR